MKNFCDHNHETTEEVRLLPTSGGALHGNMIVCRRHYEAELDYRRATKSTLGKEWDAFPAWDSLKVYIPMTFQYV